MLAVVNAMSLVCLKVSGSLVKLKRLTIMHCRNLKHIEISASNPEMFNYVGPSTSISFNHVPRFVWELQKFLNSPAQL
ncbi:FBD-like protein [Quillaja saponaria]|uniref:FBD-like protein n=1 Tax=Quillaja saponaria TaxID=32244 RepID=A0AAD7LBG4_QUISA|nr:FBD-like protein [Quillaja saponaria]